jgi:hypothetical protein
MFTGFNFDVAWYNFYFLPDPDFELSVSKIGEMDVLLIQGFEIAADAQRFCSMIAFSK